ncbi:Drug resistance transporter, EmrB/QacA family [Pseudomonas syringae pv. cunninghamiae]|nr:Drug resistance transporter, EmrB/QacA family [Pseudomonas syringae pv. cunninghamiae]
MSNSAAPIMDEKTLRWMPWVIAIAFFMQSLDGTILNTALPSMASSLAQDPLRMQSVVIAYMLTIALLIPASGWIADRFGIKRIFFSAILLFSFGSLLCALSWSLNVLVAARVIQGAGWRADAAHRTPDRLTCVSSVGAGTDHGLYHRARSFGTVAGADAWRLDGRVPELALDFPAQYSSRDSRLLRRQTLHPRPSRRRSNAF